MAADLAIKQYMNRNQSSLEGKLIAGGRARLHLMRNRGFAGNRLESHTKLVKGVSAASVLLYTAAFVYILRTPGKRFLKVCLAAALGGALGNTIERLTKGSVTDYLQTVGKKKKGRYVYNFADICIFIGAAAGIITILKDMFAAFEK